MRLLRHLLLTTVSRPVMHKVTPKMWQPNMTGGIGQILLPFTKWGGQVREHNKKT